MASEGSSVIVDTLLGFDGGRAAREGEACYIHIILLSRAIMKTPAINARVMNIRGKPERYFAFEDDADSLVDFV